MNFKHAVVGLILGASALAIPALAQEPLVFNAQMSGGKIFALASMLAESGKSELNFVAAEADFNADGYVDVLAFSETSYYCGSGGCSPLLFLGNKKGWDQVPFNAIGIPQNWYLLDSTRNGFRMVVALGDDSEQSYAWDGQAYVEVDN